MDSKSPIMFQNGIIEVFKLNKIYDLNIIQVNSKGDVSCVLVFNKIII